MVSKCSFTPIQLSWCPLLLRLQPTSQRAGRSARFSASVRVGWSSKRLGGRGGRTSPCLGRPRLRGAAGAAGAGLATGRSGASMAVASRLTVDSALHRLEKRGEIRRVIRGIYDYPRFSKLLDQHLSPDIDQVARALARKFRWRIQPTGAKALNFLGLSTQVPARAVYLSDGPDRVAKSAIGL